jgi:hypothetical protein
MSNQSISVDNALIRQARIQVIEPGTPMVA